MATWQILSVMIIAIGLTIVADKRGIQAPILLALVGVAASFIPGIPRANIPPDLLLGIVLPPLLYSAASDFSFMSFLRRIRSIFNLGVALVLLTCVTAGAVAAWAVPGLSLPAAMILGAVLSPPDAVSAVSIGRQLGLPGRLMTILKGESLINDAAALTLFSIAVSAATGWHNIIDNPLLYFLYAAAIGTAIGLGLGAVVQFIRKRLSHPQLITALAFITPFAAYSLAEGVHASGVMAVVFAGFSLGHNAGEVNFAGRIQEREVWRVTDTLLESFVFAYIGLQFRFVLHDAEHSGHGLSTLVPAGFMVLATVIIVRIVWVMLSAAAARAWHRVRPTKSRDGSTIEPLSWQENLVLSWAGMRGVVTLAAAAGIPVMTAAGNHLPGREVILTIAFGVALATLLLHGITLPWMIHVLHLDTAREDDFRKGQAARARQIIEDTTEKALDDLRGEISEDEARRTSRWLRAVQRQTDPGAVDPNEMAKIFDIANRVLAAQREALIEERDARGLNDEVMRDVLEDLDVEQAVIAARNDRLSDL